ncbi:hypothetical protein NDU88_000793 [Pleurodeles waltl]|uniref:Uncharacterized protein n=1 Tax=Pleurodeles waltl TaxID=8319 RepID=A0AAV7L7N8_PLEWA|nr:hypothetical protein NDU88_000793 [Pleurodeles waltl]
MFAIDKLYQVYLVVLQFSNNTTYLDRLIAFRDLFTAHLVLLAQYENVMGIPIRVHSRHFRHHLLSEQPPVGTQDDSLEVPLREGRQKPEGTARTRKRRQSSERSEEGRRQSSDRSEERR